MNNEIHRDPADYRWSSTLDHDLREWSVYVPVLVLAALIVLLTVLCGGK